MASLSQLKPFFADAGFDLDDDQNLDVLSQILGCDKADSVFTAGLSELVVLALAEWLQWATAQQRFNSLSELDTSRVLSLFLRVRKAAPTVEQLVEDLAIPQGRATSMIGRMKYGQARELLKLSFAAAARDVEKRVNEATENQKRKSITVSREVLDRLHETEYAIFSARNANTFPSAETLAVTPSGRYGAIVTTSTAMWGYVIAELNDRGRP